MGWPLLFILALLLAPLSVRSQPREFRDCPDCPLMVAIPPGGFTMGVPAGEEEAAGLPQEFRGHSSPQTRITFQRGFALGKYAVTRAEYLAFELATGHPRGTSCWGLVIQPDGSGRWQDRTGTTWFAPGFAQTGNDPVVCVSWDDAQAYVRWLARRTGQPYRLPSEAEWEYAARAGTPGPRYWAGGLAQACAHANVRDYSFAGFYNFQRDATYFPCADGFAHTAPVGSFPANPFGLHDMLGNVWQWTQDCWNPSLQGQPRNGVARATGDCALRVARGGSWNGYSRLVRAGNRVRGTTGVRSTLTGFRVARTQ